MTPVFMVKTEVNYVMNLYNGTTNF